MLTDKRILLIIAGGIAAYKALDLIRRLRERGAFVRAVMTRNATEFVTPLAVGALASERAYTDLFSLDDESDIGHIRLARDADLVVVAPATANLVAKMAHGIADDLASTVLLATDLPILIAPAMNVRMWLHPATQANMALLRDRGVAVVDPETGAMAENETGPGRLAEPPNIVASVEALLSGANRPLAGRRALVTSGPTHEPIDPVRYIANRSSGKQGHAIAAALARLGAETVLVSGPTQEPPPNGVRLIPVETAREMLAACEAALPADIAVCAAAVADWRAGEEAGQKLKKTGGAPPSLALTENPDILATLSAPGSARPALVVGFAAETESVIDHAVAKRARKGCDWIVANDVSAAAGTFGGDSNSVHLITEAGAESWPALSKKDVGERLAARIADHFQATT
ncbi:bifunctional phosphopantothenoylcysteine decarboxylase/phosphopantothenate--cysteine ligase CoaBC [Inquilinus sp. CAU 1745]|uniref:bifunctional phosphopantothenoylcysteine decarboxylase/phosphopantothenate--cysteine ligase CoaBC n=1 Tax=Inquilinus sp. CAU 1745 TaxID=3140369 RepID=UPI00325BC6B7